MTEYRLSPERREAIRARSCLNCGQQTDVDHPDMCCTCMEIAFGTRDHEDEHCAAQRSRMDLEAEWNAQPDYERRYNA